MLAYSAPGSQCEREGRIAVVVRAVESARAPARVRRATRTGVRRVRMQGAYFAHLIASIACESLAAIRRVTRGRAREKNLRFLSRPRPRTALAWTLWSRARVLERGSNSPGSSLRRSPACLHLSRRTRTPSSRLTTQPPSSRSPRRRKRSSSTGGKSTQ
jgi:hypothetical protein